MSDCIVVISYQTPEGVFREVEAVGGRDHLHQIFATARAKLRASEPIRLVERRGMVGEVGEQ